MKALVSFQELFHCGYRVVQVETDDNIFEVAAGWDALMWLDCPDDATTETYFYNPATAKIEKIGIQE
jgi:hypothetical protein